MKIRWSITALAIGLLAAGGGAGLEAQQAQPDNTQAGRSDRAAGAPTADRARNDPADRLLMQKIRKSVMADRSLSSYAHNVKIIAQDGKVTLRGPVRSEDERRAIVQKATDIAGAENVIDQLTVSARKKSS